MKRFLLLGLFCLFIWHIPGVSQTLENKKIDMAKVSPASPEAAALIRYIDYPVDYHTGLPKIEIPLFEIKLNDFSLPISLNYHAGGAKLNDSPGWVGMGWTLIAEPAISRKVNTLPDESSKGYLNGSTIPSLFTANITNVRVYDLLEAARGERDYEPDDFYYRLPTASGSFVFTKASTGSPSFCPIIKYPYTPVDIAVVKAGTPVDLNFTLKDAEGHQYEFFNSNNSNLERLGSGNQSIGDGVFYSGEYTSTWKATQIRTRNNQLLTFTYHDRVRDSYTVGTDYITVLNNNIETQYLNPPPTPDFENPYCYLPSGHWKDAVMHEYGNSFTRRYNSYLDGADNQTIRWNPVSCSPYLMSYSGSVYYACDQRLLKNISFPGGEVVIEKSGNQLKALTIKNDKGEKIKTVNFYQHFYNGDNSRWLLDSVVVCDSRNVPVERYKFSYNSSPIALPSRTQSGATDYFGFYMNRLGSQQTTVDKHLVQVRAFASVRNPSTGTYYWVMRDRDAYVGVEGLNKFGGEVSLYNVLNRIDYPTGGYTKFEFENHKQRPSSDAGTSATAYTTSGNRIKKVEHCEAPGSNIITTIYKYGKNEDGIGFLREKINPGNFKVEQAVVNKVTSQTGSYLTQATFDVTGKLSTFYALPLCNLLFDGGTPVCYDYVTEYKLNNGAYEGKTVYHYGYQLRHSSHIEGTSKMRKYRGKGATGQFLSKEVFKSTANGNFAKVYGEYNSYYYPVSDDIYTGFVHQNKIRDNDSDQEYERNKSNDFTRISITGDKATYNLLTSKTEKTFIYTTTPNIPSDSVIKTTTYEYDKGTNYGSYFPVRTLTTDSKGKSVDTRTQYATSPSALLTKNWVSAVGSVSQYYDGNTAFPVSMLRNTYNTFNNNSIVAVSAMSLLRSGNEAQRATIDSYDQYGNPQQRTLPNGIKEVYLWSYKGQYPIAHIYNADYTTVASALGGAGNITTFSAKVTPTDQEINTFVAPLRSASSLSAAQVTSYTHKPLIGVSSVTDANGISSYYNYDSSGRLATTHDNDQSMVARYQYHYQNNNDLETVGGSNSAPVLYGTVSGSTIQLSWNTIAGYTYEIQYTSKADPTGFQSLARNLGYGSFSYTYSTRSEYLFRVIAHKGNFHQTSKVLKVSTIPQGFSIYSYSNSYGILCVSWSGDVEQGFDEPISYTIQRALCKPSGVYDDGNFSNVATGVTDWFYADASAANNKSFVYKVLLKVGNMTVASQISQPTSYYDRIPCTEPEYIVTPEFTSSSRVYIRWFNEDGSAATVPSSYHRFVLQRATCKSSGQYYDSDFTTVSSSLYGSGYEDYPPLSTNKGYVYRVQLKHENGTIEKKGTSSPIAIPGYTLNCN